MKSTLLLFTFLISGLSFAQGQGEVTVYSNTGEKFFVILNGIRQNDQAETNVKITGLANPYYKCKVISANRTFELDKNIIVKQDTLITYEIKEKKGKYKLRFYTETPLASAPKADPSQSTIVYHSTDNPTTTSSNVDVNTNNNTQVNTNMNTTTTTVTTNTTANNTSTDMQNGNVNESINMNISVGENGISTNVNISENGMNGENVNMNTNVNNSETITTNTSSSSSTINGQTTYEETITTTTSTSENGNTTYYEETITTTSTSNTGNYNEGNIYQDQDMVVTMEPVDNCYMSDQEASNLAKQVANESFSDDKLRVANTAAKNKCMSVAQITEVVKGFDHSEDQLSFLKAAYDRCSDKSNYYQLMETLTFSSDKEELEKYINSRR